MRIRHLLAIAVVGLLALVACGQKGPLYRPGDEPPDEASGSE